MQKTWYELINAREIPSPGLLVYPDRIEENIRRMIRMAGGVERLRPHIKTHKLPEVIRMQMAHGITRFKTATIAETEMVASGGARDVLLAYQPVGPNVARLLELAKRFPSTRFGTIVDDLQVMNELACAFAAAGLRLDTFVDVDCGMHRTGAAPGECRELYRALARLQGLKPAGLHAYDGHIHDADVAARQQRCEESFAPVLELRQAMVQEGHSVPTVVAGGTPTFPMHARRADVECSPGTCVLWDAGYSAKLPDLDFLPAALVFTRVVSRPGKDRLCLDLGHKAIASENPPPRVHLFGIPDAKAVMHSEEHLVIETSFAGQFTVGDEVYGVPWHICPTMALHAEAVVVKNGRAEASWKVVARQRCLSI